MNEKALRTLEYTKIINKLEDKAISQMGKEKARGLLPLHDAYDIAIEQQETSEAVAIILKKGSLPLGGIKDVTLSVKRVAAGGVLSIAELMNISDFLYVSGKVSKYSKDDNKNAAYERLDPLFEGVVVIRELETEINRCILSQTEVADDASRGLFDVRRNIKTSNEKIKDQLNSIIHSQSYKNMLQDAVITIRNDRYCVPVKNDYKGVFPGMVHDQSQSGATVFIEPLAVVQLNNKIKELLMQEKVEVDKVLKRLSAEVEVYGESLLVNIEILTHLDFVFAKGELSISMFGTEPKFNTNGIINIKKGRHPLLDAKTVVPTNIYLGKEFTTLLITGPNTGGKTVSLKTLGLFSLMGQAGLHIAAFDNSELAVFDDIFADIGDEQSIEQSLSTFSSHMSNIVNILGKVTGNCLVLLDELGAGTDPTEGAALGIAILQKFKEIGVKIAVTTHYSELKVYALGAEGVENASCEFDVATLRPTYKLLIGVPGKSNAFAISQKLGLPLDVIEEAKLLLSAGATKFEDVITDLEITKKSVIAEQERAESYRQTAERMKNQLELQHDKLEAQKNKILNDAKNEARLIVQKTKDEADVLFKEMQRQLRANSAKEADLTRQKIKEKLVTHEKEVEETRKPQKNLRPLAKKLSKGDKVFIHSLNQSGIVTSPPDQNGAVQIAVGNMKVKVSMQDLSLDETKETHKGAQKNVATNVRTQKSMSVQGEVNLRGLMANEALEILDKYLDDAYLSSLTQVSIIHGKGTGALRAAVTSHLKRHPHVKAFRLGTYGEGDSGVTIAELKK